MKSRAPIIIVVDPDAEFATALSSLLEQRGYHVVRRSCGTDTIRFVAEDHPELVLSEVNLLDYDSRELIDSIRAISPSTRVLFMSRAKRAQVPEDLQEMVVRVPQETVEVEPVLDAVDRLLVGAGSDRDRN